MKILLWILFLAGNAATDDNGNYYVIQMPDEETRRTPTKQFRVFWNVPTMQCKSKGIPFEHLFERYGILQNDKDSFRGEKISILYDPGLFPALLKNESTGEYKFRNGGVPQEGDLEKHMASFKSTVEQSIPDPHFSGVGIIDFESWRPVFRQNFGVLVPYKDVSYQIERKKHWIWPEPWIKAEAKRRFEEKARAFMQTTLSIAKQMRPKAQWGYYGFPYCFNMASSNMRERCAERVPAENDDTYWLWLESTALYPSVYSSNTLTTNQLAQMVRGRIREAARVRKSGTTILPYFWFRYHNTNDEYLSEADLQTAIKTMYESEASGFILWGSSHDVNTVQKCENLIQYIEKYLGPEVAKYTKYDRMENINDEVSTTVANDNKYEDYNSTVTGLPTTVRTISSTVTVSTTDIVSSDITTSTTDKSLNSAITTSTTDKYLSTTLSSSFTIADELNAQKISNPGKQSDPEYYDDDSEEQNITSIKDVNFQIDSDYFWIRPENYSHNIKKQVDDEMRRKSYVSNIELSDRTTTETTPNYQSEEDSSIIKEAPKVKTQEDDLDKILIHSTTEDEFMEGLTTITEKGSSFDLGNYESIDIMYDDVETNTKCNTNRLQDEKQDKIESQNERFGREFETYEVGSQFEDQLNEDDGSHAKIEKATEDEKEIETPNIHKKQNGSHDRPERQQNTFAKDELTAVLPTRTENDSKTIPNNITTENDASYVSTTTVGISGYFDPYPNSTHVIPITKDEGLTDDGPPVLPLHQLGFNRNTIKSVSDPNEISNLNGSIINNELTYNISKESRSTVIQKTEINSNLSENELIRLNSSSLPVIINESASSSEKQLINTTSANILLNFLKNTSNADNDDTTVNPTVEQLSILPLDNKHDDKNIANVSQNLTPNEKSNKETRNGKEVTDTATITNNFTNREEIIKESDIPWTVISKKEKKRLPKPTADSAETEMRIPILPNQVSGSTSHRVSGIRYYYCIIFYFFSVSKCLCNYYGQCS